MRSKAKYSVYLFPMLAWAIAYFGFSFDGLYGQDAYEYLRYTEALKTFLSTGKPPGDYFWGVYYPVLGSLFSFFTQNPAMALQLISVISLIVTSVYLDKIIRLLHSESKLNNIPFLFFTVSPIVLLHGLLAMSDLLGCCFTTVAIYHLLNFKETLKNKHFLFGIIFVVLAILTRYAAAVILFPFCWAPMIILIKNRNYKLAALSLLIAILIALPHLAIRSQNSLDFLSHQWLQAWDIFNLFKSHFITLDGEMQYHFLNLLYVFFPFFHPIFFVFGFILIFFYIKNQRYQISGDQKLIITSILLYAIFLGGIPFQNKRFFLLSFPLVIILLFPLMNRLFTTLKQPKAVYVAIFLAQISLALYFGKSFYERNLLEKNIIQEMTPYQGKTLYSFDIDIAMKNCKLAFNYKSLWKTNYSDFENNALLLVNEKQLEKQWKGKKPFLNWEKVSTNYKLEKLSSFSGDFNLYRIEAAK